jgi:hypothetical protein
MNTSYEPTGRRKRSLFGGLFGRCGSR